MNSKEHMIFAASTIAFAGMSFISLEAVKPLVIGGLIGSILPDIDHEKSLASSLLSIPAFIIHKLMPLRSYPHDPLIWVPLGIYLCMTYPYYWVIGLVLGYWSHLFLDSFTIKGIPVGYLFNKNHYFHITPPKLRCTSSGKVAKVLTLFLSITISCGLYELAMYLR